MIYFIIWKVEQFSMQALQRFNKYFKDAILPSLLWLVTASRALKIAWYFFYIKRLWLSYNIFPVIVIAELHYCMLVENTNH